MYIEGTEKVVSAIIAVIYCAKVALSLSVFIIFCSASHYAHCRPDPFFAPGSGQTSAERGLMLRAPPWVGLTSVSVHRQWVNSAEMNEGRGA